MGLSLRQALFASIATSAIALSSHNYAQNLDMDIILNNDSDITLVLENEEELYAELAQRIFDLQESQSQSIRNVRGTDAMWDYNSLSIPVLIAAIKSANENVTDPAEIADLTVDILDGSVEPMVNGTPTAEYASYLNQELFRQAALLDATILRAIQMHPDMHTQEELATIVIADILEQASNGISDPQRLLSHALNEALHSMDPHSRFIPQSAVQDMLNDTRGSFSGIGAHVSTDRSDAEIEERQQQIDAFLEPYYDESGYIRSDLDEDDIREINRQYVEQFPELTIVEGFLVEGLINDSTPAALAGVQPGDVVTHIDGEPVAGLTIGEAVDRIIGPSGTDVELTIRRNDEENPLVIDITRGNVAISPVRSRMIDGNVGYVHASTFNDQTDINVDRAIRELTAQGAEYFILDLRDNPGGIVGQADALVNNFIDGERTTRLSPSGVIERNTIISMRTADGKRATNFARPGTETDLPMVVLINEGSASASEIVAGVLQDYDRATVVGTQSFGKGSGQSVIPFDFERDGVPEAMAAITSFYYYVGRGEGHNIQGVGITPDIRLSDEFRAVRDPRRSEAGLDATLARPDDGNYERQSEAECRPNSNDNLAEIPEDFTLRNGNLDPWIACAVSHLRGEDQSPYISIEPLELEAPTLDTQ